MIESAEMTERFLWDFRQTLSETMTDNHTRHMSRLAKQAGLWLSIEPYDMNPCNDMTLGSPADVPMCEFWSGHFDSRFSVIEAASVAHVYGRAVVAAEAFTSGAQDCWKLHPALAVPNRGGAQSVILTDGEWGAQVIGPLGIPPNLSPRQYDLYASSAAIESPLARTGAPPDFSAGRPMAEFWVARWGAWHLLSARLISSVAHAFGQPVVGAESFTALGENDAWTEHPYSIKAVGDWAFSEGVNRFIHSPWM